MHAAGYEWAARVRALNEIEVAKARAANVVRVPLSAGADEIKGQDDQDFQD